MGMLCCFGLFLGYAVGSWLGGPWTLIGPASGFIMGFIGDMKLLRGHEPHRAPGGGYMGHETDENNAEDPVCGMQLDTTAAKYKTDLHGETYYFCSSTCESKFKEKPELYIRGGKDVD